MTSMPASRRARAITLAPRSWPSSPGLATSTRILRSAAIFSDSIKQRCNAEARRKTKIVGRNASLRFFSMAADLQHGHEDRLLLARKLLLHGPLAFAFLRVSVPPW